MKTITVSDEMYDFLLQTGKNLVEQDNRGTAAPIFFTVQEKVWEMRPDGSGDEKIINEIGEEIDIFEKLSEELANDPDKLGKYGLDLEEESDSAFLQEAIDAKDWSYIEEVLDFEQYLADSNLRRVYGEEIYRNTEQNGGAFFLTEKACNDHLKANGHNYREPEPCVGHAYRNYEIKMLRDFLVELAKGKNNGRS